MAKETAEQKLLKLIEATQKQETAAAAPVTAPAAPKPAAAVSAPRAVDAQATFQSISGVTVQGVTIPPFILQILSLLKGPAGGGKTPAVGLREFNRIFAVGVLIFAGFFAVDFMRGMNKSKIEIQAAIREALNGKGGMQGALWAPQASDFSNYAQVFSARNIFQPFERKVIDTAANVPEEKTALQKIEEQVKDLRLVGISWLDTPESASAMIENTMSGTTYFLSIGDKIQNVTVKNIYADSIVVSYGGEEMEIKL